MEERLFYVEALSSSDEAVELSGDELRHLKKVVRLKPGNTLKLFNGKGLMAEAEVESIGPSIALLRVKAFYESEVGESSLGISLLQGLLKGDKNELIVQKATELGVGRVVFFNAEHSVAKASGVQVEAKLKRLKRVALEAAKQCGRSVLPVIDLKDDLEAAVLACGEVSCKILFSEVEEERGLKDFMRESGGAPPAANRSAVALIVGPEGGFSCEETAFLAVKAGFTPVRIGPRRLRAETAAITALSLVQYEVGDLGR